MRSVARARSLVKLEKIACGDFFETLHHYRRQKASFLPACRVT
jgi:hypothetical protein